MELVDMKSYLDNQLFESRNDNLFDDLDSYHTANWLNSGWPEPEICSLA